ncbi:MAG: uspE 1, partial [Planctomycetaceae bacterium]|nr:uspE 1 [Planctomycetaceae bacterium]
MNRDEDFQRILVATDFSSHSEAALSQAMCLARHSGAQIVLVHVLLRTKDALQFATSSDQFTEDCNEIDLSSDATYEEATARVQFMVDRLGGDDLGIKCKVLIGNPVTVISQAAVQEHCDLVLVGIRGTAAWEQFSIGGTAKRLVRTCPLPVWTMQAGVHRPPKSILVATDFSDTSRLAGCLGQQIARDAGADLHLLHVVDLEKSSHESRARITTSAGVLKREVLETAAMRLAAFIETIDHTHTAMYSHMLWGTPSEQIIVLAEQLKIDLLVLGTA